MSWYFNSETVCRVIASLGVSRQSYTLSQLFIDQS